MMKQANANLIVGSGKAAASPPRQAMTTESASPAEAAALHAHLIVDHGYNTDTVAIWTGDELEEGTVGIRYRLQAGAMDRAGFEEALAFAQRFLKPGCSMVITGPHGRLARFEVVA